jgi:hypothetical protein
MAWDGTTFTLTIGAHVLALDTSGAFTLDGLTVVRAENPTSTSYADVVLADSPVAYYRMGEASGAVIDTMSGTSGTVSGTVTRDVTGALVVPWDDGAITFNGTTGYVSVADQAQLDLGDTWTIECWFKRATADVTGERCLVSKGQDAYTLTFNALGTERLEIAAGNVAVITSETGTTNDALWHHVVATKSGATVKLYKDGADVTGAVSDNTTTNNTSALNIGRDPAAAGGFWDGSIDEVALYATALSAARVLAHYNAGVGA